jgi:hypothetical protein
VTRWGPPGRYRAAVSAHDAWRRLAAAGPWVFDGLLFAAYGLALALIGTRLVVRRDLT